jgi:hypothetical protein
MTVKKVTCLARSYAAVSSTFLDGPSWSQAGSPISGDFNSGSTDTFMIAAEAYLKVFPQDSDAFATEQREQSSRAHIGIMLYKRAADLEDMDRKGACALLSTHAINVADHKSLYFEDCTGCKQLCASCNEEQNAVLAAFTPKQKKVAGRPQKRHKLAAGTLSKIITTHIYCD